MLKTVDLFAGAGGLSCGFESTGQFEIVAAAENNPNAQKTYLHNHKGNNITMISDVRGYNFGKLSEEYNGVDVVIGGPPCQGFSNANRQKNHLVSMNNSLVKEYFRAVTEMQPKAFVMENVAMLASDTHKFYDTRKDHDAVAELGIKMAEEDLVISDGEYNGFVLLDILNKHQENEYMISEELFHLINVLHKNKSNNNRLDKYIKKNGKIIVTKCKTYNENALNKYKILNELIEYLEKNASFDFEKLGNFISFQKAFRLKKELDDNEIIYELFRDDHNKVRAKVNSYPVIEYVEKILGNTYVTNHTVLNSMWFGVPQERRRFIMIGIRRDICLEDTIEMPSGDKKAKVTVGQAISDLVNYSVTDDVKQDCLQTYKNENNLTEYQIAIRGQASGIKNHIIPQTREKAMERFVALKEGENFHKLPDDMKANYSNPGRTQNSVYLRLDSNNPSGTVINVRKSMWIHPSENRAVSVREAARLQSFPDAFEFVGTKDSQYQQVGNAVPPLMAKGIAEHILKYLQEKK